MANIDSYIEQIRVAEYGEEVRGSIINALLAENDESEMAYNAAITSQTSAQNSAAAAATSATDAANSAQTALGAGTQAVKDIQAAEASAITNMSGYETRTKANADAAALSASNAATSEANAKVSETNAKTSETNAKTAENNAKTSETNAKNSETNAKASEVASAAANASAQTAADNAQTYSANASASATVAQGAQTAAQNSATDAASSAEAAKQYAQSAESFSGIKTMAADTNGIGRPDNDTIKVDQFGIFRSEKLNQHISNALTTQTGVHGVRIQNNRFQAYDAAASKWTDILNGDGITYDNSVSGLTATNVKSAIDEIVNRGGYVLPIATTTELGGIKEGNGFNIDSSTGVANVNIGQGLKINAENKKIDVNCNSNISINEFGSIYIEKTYVPMTLLASGWVEDTAHGCYTYDMGIDRPNLELTVMLRNTATKAQQEACTNAQIAGNADDYLLRAWGDKPTIDIPIMVREVLKY